MSFESPLQIETDEHTMTQSVLKEPKCHKETLKNPLTSLFKPIIMITSPIIIEASPCKPTDYPIGSLRKTERPRGRLIREVTERGPMGVLGQQSP